MAGPGALSFLFAMAETVSVTANAKDQTPLKGGRAVAEKRFYNRHLQAAAALLLCVIISGIMLFSRLVSYTQADAWQYIPLTRSSGITKVFTSQGGGEFTPALAFDPNRPVLLAASPFLSTSWFHVEDENTIWKSDTQVEIFRATYENAQGQVTVKSSRADKVVAPGTENSYTFALKNTAKGPVEYSMSMKAYLSNDSYAIPVQVKVSRDTDQRYLLGSGSAYADVLKLNTVKDSGTLKKGYVMPYTLSWQWPFEGDDVYDTMLGNLEEDLTLTIVIETLASYAPAGTGGGIPQTGDTSGIALWFTVMLASVAGLMCLLLLMRRKGEEYETM